MTHYEKLGVGATATPEEIKEAYRKLAKEWHPDRHPEAEKKAAEEKFKEISSAYETLKDPDKRAAYDGRNSSPWDYNNFNFGDFGGFSHFEPGFFGRSAKAAVKRRGQDIKGILEITLPEAASGISKNVQVNRHQPCGKCSSTGSLSSTTCHNCGGAGYVVNIKNDKHFHMRQQVICSVCAGVGKIITQACGDCHGKGQTASEETIQVAIPEGVSTNDVLRIREKGHVGEGGAGDLLIVIKVLPHDRFKREYNDILGTVSVPFNVALSGGVVKYPDLFGTEADLTIPKACKYGHVVNVSGKGIKGGDMKVSIEYSLPDLSVEQLAEVIKVISK